MKKVFFRNWHEWLKLKESNARKRAVRGALMGTSPPMPGSYAACPSTNPLAMDIAKKTGKVSKWNKFKESKGHIARPDYSIDRWIQSAQELGDDVNALVGHAKDSEKDFDKQKEKKDKDQEKDKKSLADSKKKSTPDDKPSKEAEEKTWESLRKIHKERLKNFSPNPAASSKK